MSIAKGLSLLKVEQDHGMLGSGLALVSLKDLS